jgi:hypothetical protein
MKATRLLIPAAVFLVSLGGTIGVLKLSAPKVPAKEEAVSKGSAAKVRHREENAFSEIRAFLREGNIEAAKGALRKLGERDAVAFFELLAKLPGMPGVDEIIRETAARLPWNSKEITDLLDRIGPPDWRDLAWGAYTEARIGKVPDAEIYEVGIKAHTPTSYSGIRALMEDAAQKRPDSFLEVLNREGGTSIREEFFDILMKHHPERAAELFQKIPRGSYGSNYDRRYILQARARGLPTAENLEVTMKDLGPRGSYSWDYATGLVFQVYNKATQEEREKVLDFIAAQPPLARNRMLSGTLYSEVEAVSPQEFAKILSIYTTPALQDEALKGWIESQELDPTDESWIEALPNDRLRQRAKEFMTGNAPRSE